LRIGVILEHPKLSEIFGKNVVLDLRALLVERKYGNFRNEVSHGLMPTGYFYQPSIIYLWWLALRLCLTPFFKPWTEKQVTEQAEEFLDDAVTSQEEK